MNTSDRKFLIQILETELECRYDDPEFCFHHDGEDGNNESEIRILESLLKSYGEFEMMRKWGKME